MRTDSALLAYEAFRQMFVRSREPTRRTLVEFYESDWKRISAVKEELDLSWKDFFHAIALWLAAFEKNGKAQRMMAKLVRGSGVKR
jgi:hypothetical protein